MKQVYSNATVTLIAEASEDSRSGIFTSANAGRARPVHIPFHDGSGSYCGSLYSQCYHSSHGVENYYLPGPLSSRRKMFCRSVFFVMLQTSCSGHAAPKSDVYMWLLLPSSSKF